MGETPNEKHKTAATVVMVVAAVVTWKLISPWLGGGIVGDASGGAIGGLVGWGICKLFHLV